MTEARPTHLGLPPVAGPVTSAPSDEFEALFDTLLYAVSHDVKSPLLSIGLGAELLEAASATDERARLGLEAIQRGAQDLGRLIEALTQVSRARRRPLDGQPVRLDALLAGAPPTAGAPDVEGAAGIEVRVDPRLVTEFTAAVGPPRVVVGDEDVRLVSPLPPELRELDGPPLEVLFASLGLHAGTLVTALALLQVQLDRQGGTLVLGGGHATAMLPATTSVATPGA
ncbi:MAG: hypothetical protein IT299_06105 [Dehalococcoidia bacterium]|nr:hypothetical protein [Dehalococcoidia bacterium]